MEVVAAIFELAFSLIEVVGSLAMSWYPSDADAPQKAVKPQAKKEG